MKIRLLKRLSLLFLVLTYTPAALAAQPELPNATFKAGLASGFEVETKANPSVITLRLWNWIDSEGYDFNIEKFKVVKNSPEQLVIQAKQKVGDGKKGVLEGLEVELNPAKQTISSIKAKKWSRHDIILMNPFLEIETSAPDAVEARSVFKVPSFQFKGGKDQIQVKNLQVENRAHSQNSEFKMQADFSYQDRDATKNIKNGHGELSGNFIVPWEEIARILEHNAANPQNPKSVLPVFAQKVLGTDFELKLDLGENYFDLDADTSFRIPIENALAPYLKNSKPSKEQKRAQTETMSAYRPIPEEFNKLWDVLGRQLALKGEWNFSALIKNFDYFTKQMKFLSDEEVKEIQQSAEPSGDKNSLKFTMSYKNRQATLNGKPNAMVQKIFDGWGKK